ncbi:MAG: N-acetylmuramoyl-L-alanine amidase, partial [Cyanobacteria bacterium P01_A01_bin.70]
TPSDGRGNGPNHSGYTQAQYESLAWLIAQSSIPESRLTTHKAVDRSGSRQDPRTFDTGRFLTLLRRYPNRAGLS